MIIMENKNNINEIKKIEEQINQIKKLKIDEISDKFLYESICQDEILGKHTLLTLYRTSNRPKDNNDNELEQNKNLINNILKANVSKTCIANIINDIKKVIEVFDQNKIEKSITLDDKPKSKSKKRKKAKAKKQKSNSIDFNSEDEDDNGLTSKSYDSMFMSSLNGEENEYSSDEESLSDFIEEKRPKKKNRMGQRERQKLWEKNYGKNANHLKKAREMKLKEAKKEKNNKLPENLHPSWEAKRLLKEKSKIVEFTGKKITFDDNDEDTDMTDSKPAFQNKIKDPKVKKIKELHPSWEAKKLKELKEQAITHSGIKGTKIVFDDDD
ncbi:hypothetical protein BCR32DRAFT_270606 [Anaeromyces robustus]|uniref:Bud22 domain-containing protein n=1 Tax=Anaeromyces robustus TaxID=1754192 RepID=A0A1Y1WWM3_9FUNG|nr:hypothetical protein BCR32DRAFT_270606 [Anaeromyces robustus]|eukprot:ORX77534.1 hypothetical protein BCR32DRAFT_270606 [Anaeromyces robustus]